MLLQVLSIAGGCSTYALTLNYLACLAPRKSERASKASDFSNSTDVHSHPTNNNTSQQHNVAMADKMEGVTGGGHAVDPSNYPVPIETIWVGNLEERVKIPTLKAALTVVFKRFGPIVDIIAKTSLKRKGQAFVVFDSEKSALESVELMDGFPMYGKEMKVQRAKTHSDATVKSKAADMFDDHKRKRLMQKDFKRAKEDAEAAANPAAAEKPRTLKSAISVIPDEYVRPNKVLFLQNLPDDIDEDNLTTIFERFEGFKEIRYLSVRAVGFAEFENEQYAITAKEATANMPVGAGKRPMKVSYQRE
ncbi:unnamed protein product [Periconia digitata]|uniref:RRM domain-containing protein n=1 Tax=Periconia digitata TaxID=1303443 RepID=A0A9W4UCN5_9PLEO|nr:unnamed protein product [Periconia digitata]